MANLMDYIAWRGDLAFGDSGFNEVDNLVLAELAYAEFSGIAPEDFAEDGCTLREAAATYADRGYISNVINDPGPLLAAAGRSRRFGDVRLSGYRDDVDTQLQFQFSAECFSLPDGTVYVAFRGTDNTIVGWREDFNFSFMETAGQAEAAAYLRAAADFFRRPLRVGGHSKGGNLAVYAAAFSGALDRVLNVYSNDGPGFNGDVCAAPDYLAALDKVTLIVPEFSVVGILLNNKSDRKVVKSSASGAMQHNPLTWQVLGPGFEQVDSQSPAGIFMDETMQRWIGSLNREERAALTNAIFDALDASGAKTLDDIRAHWSAALAAILRAARQMEPDKRREVAGILRRLSAAGRYTLLQDARASLEQLSGQTLGVLKREGRQDDAKTTEDS